MWRNSRSSSIRVDQQNDYGGSRWYIKDTVGVSERDGEYPVTKYGQVWDKTVS